MKKTVFFCCFAACALFFGAALSAQEPCESTIQSVTVSPDQARIVRHAKVTLKKGENTFVFAHLPVQAQDNSFEVAPAAAYRCVFAAVKNQYDRAENPDYVRARDALWACGGVQDRIQNRLAFIETQLALVRKLQPSAAAVKDKPLAADGWATLLAFSRTEFEKLYASRRQLKLDLQTALLDVKAADENWKRLGAYRNNVLKTYEVTLYSACDQRVDVTFSYTVSGAKWTPEYDLSCSGTALDAVDETTLTCALYATVTQRSGEDWINVPVTLTYRPIQRADTAQGDALFAAIPSTALYADGLPHRILLEQRELRGTTALLVRPAVSDCAYRVAFLRNESDSPLPAGNATLSLDGVFTGSFALPNVPPRGRFELALCADRRFAVDRASRTQTGTRGLFFKKQRTDVVNEVTVFNALGKPVTVLIDEVLPVNITPDELTISPLRCAAEEDETFVPPNPSVKRFVFQAEPGENTLDFSYSLTYPRDSILKYGQGDVSASNRGVMPAYDRVRTRP